MQTMITSWVKYCLVVGLFGVCSNLIYLALPIYIMVVYDRVLFSFSMATLATMSVGVLISLAIMAMIEYFRTSIMAQAGNSLVQHMTPYVLKMMHRNAAAINRQGYTRGLHDLNLLRNALVQGHIFQIFELPWVLMYLGILFYIHPLVGGVAATVVFMAVLFQLLLRILEKKRYSIAEVAFQTNADGIAASLQHADVVSGMGMQTSVSRRYQERNNQVLRLQSEADALHCSIGSITRFFHFTGLAAVFGAGAYVFFANAITGGVIFAGVLITARLFYPLERSLSNMQASIEAVAAYKRLSHFVPQGQEKTKLSLPEPAGMFTAEGLSLGLSGKMVLQNISFALEPGETLGVVGPSSAGKTSLCRLLLGIWPAATGKIRLDGAEIAQWPEEELAEYIGYMPQEPELFPASVAENIARLREVDSEKVVKAAQKAGIHEMILQLPLGYDTKIDQNGKNLSAGQRQLISLARALYGTPKFVVLDEPDTYLDDLGRRMLFHALNNLKQDKVTTVVVADRTNIIVSMDKLLVIRDGQVAMYGPGKAVLKELANKQKVQQAAGA
jgi:PrtD family type I secretion system ABC transporter